MPYSKKHKLFFIHIPKTAGTTIEKALNIQHLDCLFSETKYLDKLTTPQHFTLKEIEELNVVNLNEYSIFSVVRNPFDRIVSEFYHIQYNDWATEYKNLSFERFIEKALTTDIEKRIKIFDAHIEPQFNFVDSAKFVHIFKYENLENCFRWLRNKTKQQLSFSHERKTDRPLYQTLFKSNSIKDLMFEFYKKDFSRFEYFYEDFPIEYEI